MQDYKSQFFEILSRHMEGKIDISHLPGTTRLDSLGLDSLTYLEAINELEDEADIVIPYSANDGTALETINDLLSLIENMEKTDDR